MKKTIRNIRKILLYVSLLLSLFSSIFGIKINAVNINDERFKPPIPAGFDNDKTIDKIGNWVSLNIPHVFDKSLGSYLFAQHANGRYYLIYYPKMPNIKGASNIKYAHDGMESATSNTQNATTCNVTMWSSESTQGDKEASVWKCTSSTAGTSSNAGKDFSEILYPVADHVEWGYHLSYEGGLYKPVSGTTVYTNENGDVLYRYEPIIYEFEHASGGYFRTRNSAQIDFLNSTGGFVFHFGNVQVKSDNKIQALNWAWVVNGKGLENKFQDDVTNGIKDVNKSVNDVNKSLNNSEVDTSSGSDFFGGFNSDSNGLTAIVIAPLQLIKSINNQTCTDVPLPLPYIDVDFKLPCMTTVYNQMFPGFLKLWQAITTGFVSYYVLVRMLATVKNLKSPDNDDIEVVDL